MSFLVESSRIILNIDSFKHTHSTSAGVRNELDHSVDLASDSPNYEWVDRRVLDVPTCFRGPTTLDGFLSKVSILNLTPLISAYN